MITTEELEVWREKILTTYEKAIEEIANSLNKININIMNWKGERK